MIYDYLACNGLTLRGLVTSYVLFFIYLESRRVEIAGITPHSNEAWMKQITRNVTMDEWGFLEGCRYLIHDRDTKFTDSFRAIVKSGHEKPLKLPARSPNLNAYAERWVKSVKQEALSKLRLFDGASLRRVLREYLIYFQRRRPGPPGEVFLRLLASRNYLLKLALRKARFEMSFRREPIANIQG